MYGFKAYSYTGQDFVKGRNFYLHNRSFPERSISVVCGLRKSSDLLELVQADSSLDIRREYKEPFILYQAQDYLRE